MITPDRTVPTTCPYCGVGCQIDLHIKNEMVYRVDGRFDNDVNNGKLCVKGRFGYDFIHAPDRLTSPFIKNDKVTPIAAIGGWQGDKVTEDRSLTVSPPHPVTLSGFNPTSWENALDTVATRLRETREKYGPDSIAILTSAKCTNEENYLLQKFARAVIGTNNVDHCARL